MNASYGPPGIDVGHCRVNCAVLFAVDGANRFLSAYLEQAASVAYEPHWDCRTLVEALEDFSFDPTQRHDVGRTELDHAAIAVRLDAYAASVCARLD